MRLRLLFPAEKAKVLITSANNLELLDALYDTLDSTDVADSERQLNIPSHPRHEPSLSEHRTNYEVTAKLFVTDPDYSKWNEKTLNDAFECLHRTTSLGSVDSLIFSFNGLCDDTSDSSDRLDAAARIWKVRHVILSLTTPHFLKSVTYSRIPAHSTRCCRFRSDRAGQAHRQDQRHR